MCSQPCARTARRAAAAARSEWRAAPRPLVQAQTAELCDPAGAEGRQPRPAYPVMRRQGEPRSVPGPSLGRAHVSRTLELQAFLRFKSRRVKGGPCFRAPARVLRMWRRDMASVKASWAPRLLFLHPRFPYLTPCTESGAAAWRFPGLFLARTTIGCG